MGLERPLAQDPSRRVARDPRGSGTSIVPGREWEKTIYGCLRNKPQVESRGTAHADMTLSSFVKLYCSLSTRQEESRIYL